jgi:hypothetical protein
MHGECKTPGGKMVVADFEVRDGRLTNIQISGDFFLYPEEAIFLIPAALNGASIDADLARLIATALPPETEMLGFSPEAVEEAIRRGLAE